MATTAPMDLPVHLASARPNLDPYGHLLRMLMPRALGIGFYDAKGVPLWVADGYDGPDPAPLVALALERVPRLRPPPGSTASATTTKGRRLTSSGCATARARSSPSRPSLTRDGENRPYQLRPVLGPAGARVPAARARGARQLRHADPRLALARRRPRAAPQVGARRTRTTRRRATSSASWCRPAWTTSAACSAPWSCPSAASRSARRRAASGHRSRS